MAIFQELVKNVRNLRAEAHMHPQQKVAETVVLLNEDNTISHDCIVENEDLFRLLAKVDKIRVMESASEKPPKSLMTVTDFGEVFLVAGDLLDVDSEIARLGVDLEKAEADMNKSLRKLEDESFISKAPPDIVDKEKSRLSQNCEKITLIKRNMESLSRQ